MSETHSPHHSLQLTEAKARRALLDVRSYDVTLDLATHEDTFASTTEIIFASGGGPTFLDLKPASVQRIELNGRPIAPELLDRGRVPLETSSGENRLVVEAVMRFRNDGEGLHRSVDPVDGRHYVYGMSFMDAAPSIFACFDQPDLKAPYTFHVRAPEDWTVFGNSPGAQVEPGVWEFEPSQPLSTYFVTLVAGPWHVLRDEHDGIPLSFSARQSIAEHLDKDAAELITVTRQCFDEFHRLFGIRYPFGNYHQAFVPEFNAGAMENPGCVTFRDPLLFTSKVTRGERIQRATTVAHEMAHQWFGNITTPAWWDDLWLNESFAEYMGNRVTADVTEFDDTWVHNSWQRRQWGLVADQRPSTHPVAGNGATDATAALQDFDGISYAKGSTVLKQLNARLGDEVFFAGVVDHFTTHRFGNATMADLFAAWERAGAGDLSSFVDGWLRTAGADTLRVDRTAGLLRCSPPDGTTTRRAHTLRVARLSGGVWTTDPVRIDGPGSPLVVAPGDALVIDPTDDTWSLALADPESVAVLTEGGSVDASPEVRAGLWNNVRSGFHNAEVAPDAAVALAARLVPEESTDYVFRYLVPWLTGKVVPLTADPEAARATLHRAFRERTDTSPAGSTLQLGAFQGACSTGAPELLEGWLAGAGLPAGVEIDLALRWRMLRRLAALGAIDLAGLEAALAADPSTEAAVEYAGARAALPDAAAKAWAWQRFTGEAKATNYELEMIGLSMWQAGQEQVTGPYVDRYFDQLPALASVHSGWVLGDVAEAYFPLSALSVDVVQRADALAALPALDPTVRRRLVDVTDELRRRIAARDAHR